MKVRTVPNNHLAASIFVVLLIVAFALRSQSLAAVYLSVAIGVVAVNLTVVTGVAERERRGALAFVIVLTAMLPISVIRGETAIVHYVVVLTSLATALLFTRRLETYLKASRYALVAAQAAVLLYLSRTGLRGFPLENILPDSSSNGVTSYLILVQANYCLINYLLTRRASLITACVTLFICFVGFGRGSLLAAIAIIAVGLLSMIHAENNHRRLLRLLILGGIGLIAYFAYSPALVLVSGTKIGLGLYDASRLTMVREYLASLDVGSLWTGATYTGTTIATQFNGNPHNSFIRAHHIFGLPYLVACLLLPIYLIHRRQSVAVRLYAAAIWAVVLFRSATEPILFPTLFDFFYFSISFALSKEPPIGRGRRPEHAT